MPAKIIVVINQKGGSGKTTVTVQLGGTIALRGYSVGIVDGDKQNSCVDWVSMAHEGQPFPANVFNLAAADKKIHQELRKYYEHYDYIFVDCPPNADSPLGKSALLVADIAIVPFIPDGLGMASATKIRDTIEDVQTLNESLKGYLLLNRVEANTVSNKKIMDMLPEFNMPQLNTILNKRAHFSETFLYGQTVHYLKNKAKEAIIEIEQLADEVLELLNNKSAIGENKGVESKEVVQ